MQPASGSQAPPLPELVNNPVASLRPFVAEVLVCDEWIPIPAHPAATWIEQFMGGDPELDAIFPGFCSDEDQEYVNECLFNGCLDVGSVQRLTLDLISQVSGRPWWVAVRMVMIAETRWSILTSDMTLRNVRPDMLSFSAWLDVLWSSIFSHLPQEKWIEMSSLIESPPPSEAPEDPMETMEMSVDMFSNLMRG